MSQSIHQEIAEQERKLTDLQKSLLDRETITASLRLSLEDSERTIQALRQGILEQENALKSLREAIAQGEATKTSQLETENAYKIALTLTLANAAYDSLLVLNEQFQIIAINNAAETLFDVVRPIGQSLVTVTQKPELESMVEDALANAEETLEEQLTIGKRSYRVRVNVIRRDGNFFIAMALQDVTELVRLNRARRDMVANISHELRTPIANIRATIDSLFHEQEKPKRKESASALRAIARETDSLLWLVQELLDLSMIESGQAILRMVEYPLKQLVDEAIERMDELSEAKDLTIVSEVHEGFQVWAADEQVRRVLINLIHNAIKWSPEGKTITITSEEVAAADEVIISVLDEGPGVPDDQTERIFERFYQVDTSRSGSDGTGLGLAICKHIVEAHGGQIWAEGNENGTRGGIFRFTLGLVEQPQERQENENTLPLP
jgi:two-component system phosphate regulon sensor histidine kinase PhoR